MILDEHELMIDGIQMPRTSKINIQYNPLWATGSGRMSNGVFDGYIQSIKWRVDAEWSPISEDDLQLIMNTVYNGESFHRVTFKNPKTKKYETKTMYVGDLKADVYNYTMKEVMYKSLPLSFVEQ